VLTQIDNLMFLLKLALWMYGCIGSFGLILASVGLVMKEGALPILVGAPLLLAAVALAVCYLPARRSLRIDPAVSLRQE